MSSFVFMNQQRNILVHDEATGKIEKIDWEFVPFGKVGDRRGHPAYGFHVFETPLPLRAEQKGEMSDRTEHGPGRRTYFFKVDGKDENVLGCCKRYLALLERLVEEFR